MPPWAGDFSATPSAPSAAISASTSRAYAAKRTSTSTTSWPPPSTAGQRPPARFKPYIQQRYRTGGTNAAQRFREVRAQGYNGSKISVREDAATLRAGTAISKLVLVPEALTSGEGAQLSRILEACPDLRSARDLAHSFNASNGAVGRRGLVPLSLEGIFERGDTRRQQQFGVIRDVSASQPQDADLVLMLWVFVVAQVEEAV